MPVVSQTVIPRTPVLAKRSTQCINSAKEVIPDIGQPKLVDKEIFTAVLFACANSITELRPLKESSRLILRLAWLCASLTDMTKLNSSTPTVNALSAPLRFGIRTVYSTPGSRLIPFMTASASASMGIAFGLVKELTSILAYPARLRRLIRAIFSSVGINALSA